MKEHIEIKLLIEGQIVITGNTQDLYERVFKAYGYSMALGVISSGGGILEAEWAAEMVLRAGVRLSLAEGDDNLLNTKANKVRDKYLQA